MHILIAPNAFKNSLTAGEAAAAIQRGLTRSRLTASTECFPVADGGDGTGDLLIQRLRGQRISAQAHDPLGRPIAAEFGLLPSHTAIIEMATASGIRLLNRAELNPLHATSAGTGDLIRAALDHLDRATDHLIPAGLDHHARATPNHPARRIIIGMGGSATVDGGTGILRALGASFLNTHGQPLDDLPAQLPDLDSIDLSDLDPRLAATELIVLCDVTNPLTGPQGAATVFGPQKGASPAAILQLESGLQKFAQIILRQTGIDLASLPRTGTAGGAAAGLHGLLQARLVSGIDYFLKLTNFESALDDANYVITGEGGIDQSTLRGKAPFGVATHAKARGIPVIALTGRMPRNPAPLRPYFDEIICINPQPLPLREALALTAANLERAAQDWADRLASTH
ncbi:MAG TPA: glycerate kinase [Puia sp.]|jgi:glycerate kinase|nr:glycerate kinase [Puia sp.]